MFEDRAITAKQQNLWEEKEPAMTWRQSKDHFGQVSQYINEEGRIVAEVKERGEDSAKECFAYITNPNDKYESLGRYVTADAAKSAIIRALHNRAVEGK